MTSHDRPSFQLPLEEPAEPAVARPSSSVIVARDGEAGVEVFMLERHLRSDFAGGAYVFPGGVFDGSDASDEIAARLDDWTPVAAEMAEDDDGVARGLIVCAIRETFEEAGILLARTEDGAPVRLEDAERWREVRRRLAAREATAAELATRGRVRLDASLLRFWARWVTPLQAPKRYDTRFFIAMMPPGQQPLHDDVETTSSVWIRPEVAVQQGLSGERSIIFPTRKMLESLMPYPTARALFDAAVGRDPAAVLPRIEMIDGEPRIILNDGSAHAP